MVPLCSVGRGFTIFGWLDVYEDREPGCSMVSEWTTLLLLSKEALWCHRSCTRGVIVLAAVRGGRCPQYGPTVRDAWGKKIVTELIGSLQLSQCSWSWSRC